MAYLTPPILTIDGPTGVGKGTVAISIAKALGWHYLDSGVIYRVLAWIALENQLDQHSIDKILTLYGPDQLEMQLDNDSDSLTVVYDGASVEAALRTELCSQMSSRLSAYPSVRNAVLETQRAFAKLPGLVTDGRDMGTVVFPVAQYKIFLDASVEERSERRYKQLKSKGNDVKLADVVADMQERDHRDRTRQVAPLKPADDAYLIDTTRMSIDQVCEAVLKYVQQGV